MKMGNDKVTHKNGKKSYAVFGLGEFGTSVALELMEAGADVMALDIDADKISDIADKVTLAMEFDATESRGYEKLGLRHMDAVIVAMTGSLDACVMAILLAKDMGVKEIIAKARNNTQEQIFQKIGATRIEKPERTGGMRVARNLTTGVFADYIEISPEVRLIKMPVKSEWVGHKIFDLQLRNRHGINVVAYGPEDNLKTNVGPDTVFDVDDVIWLTVDKGHMKNIE